MKKSLFFLHHIIFELVQDYYNEVSDKKKVSGLVLAHQTFEDFVKFNLHWHGILLEGGFDQAGNFVYLLIINTSKMTELFRWKVIKYF